MGNVKNCSVVVAGVIILSQILIYVFVVLSIRFGFAHIETSTAFAPDLAALFILLALDEIHDALTAFVMNGCRISTRGNKDSYQVENELFENCIMIFKCIVQVCLGLAPKVPRHFVGNTVLAAWVSCVQDNQAFGDWLAIGAGYSLLALGEATFVHSKALLEQASQRPTRAK
jgi:hypothetical protein